MELKKDNEVEKGKIIFKIHKRVVELKNEIGKKLYELGAYLKQIRDNQLYRDMGLETFEEYIAQPELTFERSKMYALIGVYEVFIESGLSEHLDIEGIDYYKLDRIRQFKDNENFEEWISKARELSLSDLNAEIRIAKGGTEEDSYPETLEQSEYREVTCPGCGLVFNVKI